MFPTFLVNAGTAFLSVPNSPTITLQAAQGNTAVTANDLVVTAIFSGVLTNPPQTITILSGHSGVNFSVIAAGTTGAFTVTASASGMLPANGSGTAGASVICTELHRQKLLPDAI